jgi:hypothetical protein
MMFRVRVYVRTCVRAYVRTCVRAYVCTYDARQVCSAARVLGVFICPLPAWRARAGLFYLARARRALFGCATVRRGPGDPLPAGRIWDLLGLGARLRFSRARVCSRKQVY